jgi:hypothetical protein
MCFGCNGGWGGGFTVHYTVVKIDTEFRKNCKVVSQMRYKPEIPVVCRPLHCIELGACTFARDTFIQYIVLVGFGRITPHCAARTRLFGFIYTQNRALRNSPSPRNPLRPSLYNRLPVISLILRESENNPRNNQNSVSQRQSQLGFSYANI